MSPSIHPLKSSIDLTRLDLAVEAPPGQGLHDGGVEDRDESDLEDEFAFTKEYKFSAPDPNPDPPEKNDAEEDAKVVHSIASGTEHLLNQFKQLHTRPYVPPPEPLVQIQVRTIDRKLIPPNAFHVYMDNVCEDFLQFSVAVFTNDGLIKDSLVKSRSPHAGSRVWGSEINHGKLAYIENLRVNPKYQRQGVGRWAIESLLKSPVLADCPYIFTWATVLNTALPLGCVAQDYGSKKDGVIAFWRALGFRRVGGTWFFAYARDPQHPTRSLPAKDDAGLTQVTGASSTDVILQYQGWS